MISRPTTNNLEFYLVLVMYGLQWITFFLPSTNKEMFILNDCCTLFWYIDNDSHL